MGKLVGNALRRESGIIAIHFRHSICNFNQPKEKFPNVQVKKIQTVDTSLTNISYFYVQLYKFKKPILYVCTKVVYTHICT